MEKSADNLWQPLNKARTALSRVLFGLGIRLVGAEAAGRWRRLKDFASLMAFSKEELLQIPGVGERSPNPFSIILRIPRTGAVADFG